jgi:hypothetical protein
MALFPTAVNNILPRLQFAYNQALPRIPARGTSLESRILNLQR